MTHELVSLIAQYGLLLVALNVFVDQIGLPVPAMPTLIAAGAMAAAGHLSVGPLFAWSMAACVAPDCAWYAVGQRYGIRVLKTLCRISLEPDSCVSETQMRFDRWGVRSQIELLIARLDRIGSVAGIIVGAALAGYVAYKWWERLRFYRKLRMARITVADLYDLIQADAKPSIIDVRSPTARALEPQWIPGAIHVPLDAVERHMSGGLDAWVQAGYAVETHDEENRTGGEVTGADR